MKYTELRIGKIIRVKSSGVNKTVSCLLDNGRMYTKELLDGGEDFFEGVPLTTDILKAAGFFKQKETQYAKIYNMEAGTIFTINYVDGVFAPTTHGTEFRFVHQLQNLYFALFGQELDLTSILQD